MGYKGRGEEGSGDSEQDVVGSAGMLAKPIRLKQSSWHFFVRHDFHFEHVTRFIVDMARSFKVEEQSKAASQLGYRQLNHAQREENLYAAEMSL